MNLTGKVQDIIVNNLPALHRFIYLLNVVANYSVAQIAHAFATSPKVVEKALEAESINIERIVAAASKKIKISEMVDVDKIHDILMEDAVFTEVSVSVDAVVEEYIFEVCVPIRKKERRKRCGIVVFAGLFVAIIAICIIAYIDKENSSSEDLDNVLDTEEEDVDTETETDTNMTSEIEATHYADITIENYGVITVALDGNVAPETVENFVSLAESGFYDGLTFHRIMERFVMQGGDPNADGTGGSENTITGEFIANGVENYLSHIRGAISMARADDYNSASSQFFIVHEDNTESLDGLYACFGYVTEGMDIVDAICGEAEPTDSNGMISAENQPIITSIVITKVEDTTENVD